VQDLAADLPDRGFFVGGLIGGGPLSSRTNGIARYSTYDYVRDWVSWGEGGAFGAGLFAGYDFGLFTGQLEFLFTTDRAKIDVRYEVWDPYGGYSGNGGFYTVKESSGNSGTILQIPLIAKVDLHLWRFVFQPLAGLYLNFGLGKGEEDFEHSDYHNNSSNDYKVRDRAADWDNPLLGWVAGGTVGFHLGPGFVFFEARYMANFGATKMHGQEAYRRSATVFGGGYQYYFK
jgi:hypothetical protein